MALEGPQLRFIRVEEGKDSLERALELMRQVEDLLESAPTASRDGARMASAGTHSTRIARAMAASLVDELEALVRGEGRIVGSG
jgi:hypothetical protein